MKHSVKDWVVATRPWSFPASAMPVAVTMAWLWSQGLMDNWLLGLMALTNIILVHAAGNVWSDFFDFRRGVDAKDTFSVTTLVDGHFTQREVLMLSLCLQTVAVIMGVTMVCLTGVTLLWIGLAGIILSLCYPPLKYAALGDVVIMACYALLPMLGVTFICHGSIVSDVLWLAVPVGSITVAILHGNNTRDIETDSRAHIRTFALLTGRDMAALVYVFELLLPYLWLIGTAVVGVTTSALTVSDTGLTAVSPWCLTTLLTIPVAWRNITTMLSYRTSGLSAIASLDEATAKLQLAFSITLILGLVCATLI